MVKFGKNKFKALNKIAKNHKAAVVGTSNKVLKKKQNSEKKVTFQKEVLLQEAATGGSALVKNVTAQEILLNELSKKPERKKTNKKTIANEGKQKAKQKPVEKQKKRQKTQINDTKLLLSLMKKKR